MGSKRYKQLQTDDFLNELEEYCGNTFANDFKKTYYYTKISEMLIYENHDLYIEKDEKVTTTFLGRLTLPLLLILYVLLFLVLNPLNWLFKGKKLYLNNLGKFGKFIKYWSDKSGLK